MDAPEKQEAVEFAWTPEAVAKTLDSICRRCGFMLRRARWLRMLAHAQVVWQMKTQEAEWCRALILNNGDVTHRLQIQKHGVRTELTAPDRTRAGAAALFDLETYDRLRVLTTEIRRLVIEARLVHIRLGESIHLYPNQLRRLLHWI